MVRLKPFRRSMKFRNDLATVNFSYIIPPLRGPEMSMMCTVLGHRRSAKRAKFDFGSQRWHSVCLHCREPMVRIAHGEWQLASEIPEEREPELA
jgi:hypothetical protein